MITTDKGQVPHNTSEEALIDYCVSTFNLIRETVKVDWDDEGECMITGRENGTIEFVSVAGTLR
jgi:hypothetical protein